MRHTNEQREESMAEMEHGSQPGTALTAADAADRAIMAGPINILIVGGETPLALETVRALRTGGHRVTATVATHEGARVVRAAGALPAYPNLTRVGEIRSAIVSADAQVIVNLGGQAANYAPFGAAAWNADVLASETAALVEAAKAAGTAHFIHASFTIAGGDSEAARPVLQALRRAEKTVLRSGVPATVLRFGYLYGPTAPVLAGLKRTLMGSRPMPAASSAPAGWVHDADAARALVLAATAQPSGAVLDIVDDAPTAPQAFLAYFAQAQGLAVPGLPPFIGRLLESRMQAALSDIAYTGSPAAAREALGWRPRFSTVHAGIDDILLQWRAVSSAAPAAAGAVR
jgi:nucleoside-diphosphate-sugar epimerase